jgi:hypothetical protein
MTFRIETSESVFVANGVIEFRSKYRYPQSYPQLAALSTDRRGSPWCQFTEISMFSDCAGRLRTSMDCAFGHMGYTSFRAHR